MPHRIRSILVSVSIDKVDDAGNVLEELTSQPVKVFPSKFGAIGEEALQLVARLNAEEAALIPPTGKV